LENWQEAANLRSTTDSLFPLFY